MHSRFDGDVTLLPSSDPPGAPAGFADMTLPPGQHRIDGFPRFGGQLSRPAPAVPAHPVIKIRGVVTEAFDLPLATLATLPRRELTADFHCVAGWSATNLRWEGVSFETVYRTFIEPALPPDTAVTHVVFGGLDGWRSVVLIDDAMADDVLVAEHLDGHPLDGDHGAPARLVSPSQYGFVSTKHLCRIEVHTSEPKGAHGSLISRLPMQLLSPHPRARVWEEERHRYLPPWLLRRAYRATIAPFVYLSARGGRDPGKPRGSAMRLPNAAHESHPWRIRQIASDFTLEDVWALPAHGGAEDFQTLLELMVSLDPANAGSLPTRVLWRVRDRLGDWFDLGRISDPIDNGRDDAGKLPIPGTNETSLTARLPDDLRNTAADVDFGSTPFAPLYRTDVEFAAELSNRTVHALMHLAWVDQGGDRYQGQMAVYVKPRGPLGQGYMAFIKPFRHCVVYPALMAQIERRWNTRVPQ